MSTDWQDGAKRRDRLRQAQYREATRKLKIRARLDITLVSGLLLAGLGLAVGLFLIFQVADLLDPGSTNLIAPVVDERKLDNIRDDLDQNPLLAASGHSADGRLYVSQSDGDVFRYDPQTQLWRTEQPFADIGGIQGRISDLYSGNGDAQNPLTAPPLWALGDQGALAMKDADGWRTLVGDQPFMAGDQPVSGEMLTSAAASDDGEWLVVGTRGAGLGFYHQPTRSWRAPGPEYLEAFDAAVSTGEITRMAYWRGRFWAGGPDGLVSVSMGSDGPVLEPGSRLTWRVIDLDADPNDRLWVLARKTCVGKSGDDCIYLAAFNEPDQPVQVFIDERRVFPDLDLSRLHHAEQSGNMLMLAGDAGIYVYDIRLRRWEQPFEGRVLTVAPFPSGDGFAFGYVGGFGYAASGIVTPYPTPGRRIVQVTGSSQENIMGLAGNGMVFGLNKERAPVSLFRGVPEGGEQSVYTNALKMGDEVLLLGRDNALVHHLTKREYAVLQTYNLPDWLLAASTELSFAGNTIYGVARTQAGRRLYSMSRMTLYSRIGKTTQTPIGRLTANSRMRPWDDHGVFILDGNGIPRRYLRDRIIPLVGRPAEGLNNRAIKDVTSVDKKMMVVTDEGVRAYDLETRSWSRNARHPGGDRYTQLEGVDGLLLARTENGALRYANTKATELDFTPVMGWNRIPLSDAQLTDVLFDPSTDRLFLAGAGKVVVYSTVRRGVLETYQLSGSGEVTMVGVHVGSPIAVNGGKLWFRNRELDSTAGQALTASLDKERIWVVRERLGARYLKGYDLERPELEARARCLFRAPKPPLAFNQVLDAAQMPEGQVAVLTDGGLQFYNPQARSWYAPERPLGQNGGRVFAMGEELVLAEEEQNGSTRLTFINYEDMAFPNPCVGGVVRFTSQTRRVGRYTVDERQDILAVLQTDGAVNMRRQGRDLPGIAGPGGGPNPNDLRRVYDRRNGDDDHLWFTTDTALLRYDLSRHLWTKLDISLDEVAEPVVDIQLMPDDEGEWVVVRTRDGQLFAGLHDNDARTSEVAVSRIYNPDGSALGATPDEIVDILGDPDSPWTFVLNNRLVYFDPAERVWIQGPDLPPGERLTYSRVGAVDLLVGDDVWYVARQYGESPGGYLYPSDFARAEIGRDVKVGIDANRRLWRLDRGGKITYTDLPEQGDYRAFRDYDLEPMRLDPADVSRAFNWPGGILFETNDGLRLYDNIAGRESALPAEIAGMGQPSAVYRLGNIINMFTDTRLLTLQRVDGEFRTRTYDNIGGMRADRSGGLWALRTNGWMRWDGVAFRPSLDGDNSSVTPIPGSDTTRIDGQGFPHFFRNRSWRKGIAPLPEALRDNALLIWGENDCWWVIKNNKVYFVQAGRGQLTLQDGLDLPAGFADLTDRNLYSAQASFYTVSRAPIAELKLTNQRGQVIKATYRFKKLNLSEDTGVNAQMPHLSLPNSFNQIRRNFQRMEDGSFAYDPVTDMTLSPAGSLAAVRSSGLHILGDQGALEPAPLPSLDTGRIRWDKQRRLFLIAGPQQVNSLKLDDMIRGGRMIFEQVDAVIPNGQDGYTMANRYGLWQFSEGGLFLNDEELTYAPVDLGAEIRAGHGRFVSNRGTFASDGRPLTNAEQEHVVSLGAVRIVEDLRTRRVRAQVTSGGREINAFASQGFTWDQERFDLAFDQGRLLILSGVGLHGADSYDGFEAGPEGIDLREGRLMADAYDGLLFRAGDRWFQRGPQGWSPRTDPGRDRTLIDTPAWSWRLNNGALDVTLVGETQAQRLSSEGFPWDRLRGAAAGEEGLYVMNEAFLEARARITELQTISAMRGPTQPLDAVTVRRTNVGAPLLTARINGEDMRLDPLTANFVRDPQLSRQPLLELTFLRFLPGDQGLRKELRLMQPDNSATWVPFQFKDGRFPFDVVTSVMSDDDFIYVGSEAGLQLYNNTPPFRTRDIQGFLALSPNPTEPTPVRRMRRSVVSGGRVLIYGQNHALVHDPDQPFRWTNEMPAAGDDIRIDTNLWRWIRRPDGSLSGRYKLVNGTYDRDIVVQNGRYPHDNVTDMIIRNGSGYVLWGGRYLTRYDRLLPALDRAERTYEVRDFTPQTLMSVDNLQVLANSNLESGLYLTDRRGNFARVMAVGLLPINDPEKKTALETLLMRPPIVAGTDLRLLENRRGLNFEYRVGGNQWRPLPWVSGRVALDRWEHLHNTPQGIWAATPAGMARFDRLEGDIRLNPNRLTLITRIGDVKLNNVSDLHALEDGRVRLRLNQSSEQVYEGRLTETPANQAFQRIDTDPFAEGLLVDTEESGLWEWRRMERRNGRSGYLSVSLAGETPKLVGGRFDFDSVSSLALFREGRMEFATDAAGWYSLPRDTLDLRGIKRDRPRGLDPLNVRQVGITRVDNDQQLVLQTYTDVSVRIGERLTPERVEGFREMEARDALWSYYREGDRLTIETSKSRGGVARRLLLQGRFQDDIIRGRPLIQEDQATTLLPTRAGILSLDNNLTPSEIRVGNFNGLPEDTPPEILFLKDGAPAYMTPKGIYQLEDGEERYKLELGLPDNTRLVDFQREPEGSYQLFWRGETGWCLQRLRADFRPFPAMVALHNVMDLEKFQENRIAFGDPIPWLSADYNNGGLRIKLQDFETVLPIDLPRNFKLVGQVREGDQLYLFGSNEILSVRLNNVLDELFTRLPRPNAAGAMP